MSEKIAETKWKKWFFLLLGVTVGQGIGRFIFATTDVHGKFIATIIFGVLWFVLLGFIGITSYRKGDHRHAMIVALVALVSLGLEGVLWWLLRGMAPHA